MKAAIAKLSLCTALTLVVASFLPWTYLTTAYYIFRYAIMGLIGISLVLTFSFKRTFAQRFMRIFLLTLTVVFVEFFLFRIFHLKFQLEDFSQLLVAFVCISIGMNLDADLKFWKNVCYYYTLGIVVMGLVNCYYYAGGFYVPEEYLFDTGKNQVGILLAIGAASLFFLGMKDKEKRVHFWLVFFLALVVLLLIRARSSVLALLACVILVMVKDGNWKWKWSLQTVISVGVVGWLGYILYTGFVGDELQTFFSGGKDLEGDYYDALSCNRTERNKLGWQYFCSHLVSGELLESSGIKCIHNYVLLRLARYGIWSFPFILFYVYFGIKVLIKSLYPWHDKDTSVGIVVFTLPFVISFLEPSSPYGPGEVQLLAFLLLGFSMRSMADKKRENKDPIPSNAIPWYHEARTWVSNFSRRRGKRSRPNEKDSVVSE